MSSVYEDVENLVVETEKLVVGLEQNLDCIRDFLSSVEAKGCITNIKVLIESIKEEMHYADEQSLDYFDKYIAGDR